MSLTDLACHLQQEEIRRLNCDRIARWSKPFFQARNRLSIDSFFFVLQKLVYTREVKGLDLVRRDWCLLSKTVGQ